jgi:hypothetical protein
MQNEITEREIKVVKHNNPKRVDDIGDILYPFLDWENTGTGAGWFSAPERKHYGEQRVFPLVFAHHNPWTALQLLGIETLPLLLEVLYACPFFKYNKFYWAVPLLIFTDDPVSYANKVHVCGVEYWDNKFLDDLRPERVRNWRQTNMFPLNSIQEILLGHGYTEGTLPQDGNGSLCDAIMKLSDDTEIGMKIWMWYNQ